MIGAAFLFGLFAMLRPQEKNCTGGRIGCNGDGACERDTPLVVSMGGYLNCSECGTTVRARVQQPDLEQGGVAMRRETRDDAPSVPTAPRTP